MATFKFYPVVPAGNGGTNVIYAGTLASAGTQSVTTGNNMLIRIVGSQPLSVRFGSIGNSPVATATDIYIPGNTPEIFDMGQFNNVVSIYSFAAGNIVTVNQVVKN